MSRVREMLGVVKPVVIAQRGRVGFPDPTRQAGSDMAFTLVVNGIQYGVDVEPETPLLWVLRDSIGLTGTKCLGLCRHGTS